MPKRWTDGDESREVLVFRAKPIGKPAAHRWPNKDIGARVQLKQRSAVRGIRPVNTLDDTKVIGHFANIWEEIGYFNARLTVAFEFPWALEEIPSLRKDDTRTWPGVWLSMITRQERLMVEGVDLTWTTVHEDKDNPLCLWFEVRCFWRQWIDVLWRRSDGICV
jgi:hypothetical protein